MPDIVDVRKVFITKEVADKLGVNPSYLIRVAKKMLSEKVITDKDMRDAGKRNYIFNEKALQELQTHFEK